MHDLRLFTDLAAPGFTARLRGARRDTDPEVALVASTAAAEHWLTAGAHVLLVAAPVPAVATILRLCDLAQQRGRDFAVVNPDRYLPSRRLLRAQLDAHLGAPGLLRLHRWGPAAFDVLRDLDLVLWLMGQLPERVYALKRNASGQYLQIHLGFPGGGMALLDLTDRLPPGDGYLSLSVIAAHGAAYADDHQNVQLAYRGGTPVALRTDEGDGHLAALTQEFLDAVRAGQSVPTREAEWRAAHAVADAVRRSLSAGNAVALEGP